MDTDTIGLIVLILSVAVVLIIGKLCGRNGRRTSRMSTEMSEPQKRMIDRAIYLRGRIITHFAQCEFLLADISTRVDGRFVYLLKKRVKALAAITAEGGPYEQYAAKLMPLAEGVLRFEEIRNFLVHGMMFLLFVQKTQEFVFEFRRYKRLDDKSYQHLNWFISLDELEKASEAVADHCTKFINAFRQIYTEQNLEREYRELFE